MAAPSGSRDDSAARRHNSTTCSVCLNETGEKFPGRGVARLACGHIFHLACIVSKFNAQVSMTCPNCKFTENNIWLCTGCGTQESPIPDPVEMSSTAAGQAEVPLYRFEPVILPGGIEKPKWRRRRK